VEQAEWLAVTGSLVISDVHDVIAANGSLAVAFESKKLLSGFSGVVVVSLTPRDPKLLAASRTSSDPILRNPEVDPEGQ